MAGNAREAESQPVEERDRATSVRPRFWERVPLAEMTAAEWEALCDGCAKCCLVKLEDEDTGEVHYTDVACTLLDIAACRCRDYANRKAKVPGCTILTPRNIAALRWMPQSCAYRRLADGKPLPAWHPLLTGEPTTVVRAGHSVSAFAVPEDDVPEDEWEDHVIAAP